MGLLKKVHTYAGLLTFLNLAVYGTVGLSVTFLRRMGAPPAVTSYRQFSVEPNLTDRRVAERVDSQLKFNGDVAGSRIPIQHDAAGSLLLDFHDANRRSLVTVLEKEGRIRIETTTNNFGMYLDALHRRTASIHSDNWRMQLWGDYNEFAMWCLLTMIGSGFAMFLTSRRRSRLAQISLAAGCCAFAAMYLFTR